MNKIDWEQAYYYSALIFIFYFIMWIIIKTFPDTENFQFKMLKIVGEYDAQNQS